MNPKLFLRAAELIEKNDAYFACCAIDKATRQAGTGYAFCKERAFFFDTFRPQPGLDGDDEREYYAFFSAVKGSDEAKKRVRVLALCFAHAMGGEL